ncbi:hypothetical protein [Marinobacter sp.]|uniref:hypothetical protein n=1 Tax=Marinobacter sp. TaxID=50741 RepID=UPI002356052C|nr:hypothetical protein [Marinobacter sp.]
MRSTLMLALLLLAAPALAQSEVTPEQIEDLKERIEDIDDWLADAEEDRSELEQQLAASERKIGRLTRERRSLRERTHATATGPERSHSGADRRPQGTY